MGSDDIKQMKVKIYELCATNHLDKINNAVYHPGTIK